MPHAGLQEHLTMNSGITLLLDLGDGQHNSNGVPARFNFLILGGTFTLNIDSQMLFGHNQLLED